MGVSRPLKGSVHENIRGKEELSCRLGDAREVNAHSSRLQPSASQKAWLPYGVFVVTFGLTLIAAYYAVAPTRGSTLLLVATASDLGLSRGQPAFDYLVSATSLFGDEAVSDVMDNSANSGGDFERARYDAFRPVVRNSSFQLLSGGRGFDLPLVVDAERLRSRRGDRGWLVVALDDAAGAAQADTVSVGAIP